jgi:zinc transporter ZupT
MSEAEATIVGAIIGATIGGVFGLLGVWVGYFFSKHASEGDRQTELQYTIY